MPSRTKPARKRPKASPARTSSSRTSARPAKKPVARPPRPKPPAPRSGTPATKSSPAAASGPATAEAPRIAGRRHVLSLSFLRDGDEFLARIESDSGQITELKNRALDQLLTLVAGELEDLLE